ASQARFHIKEIVKASIDMVGIWMKLLLGDILMTIYASIFAMA
ncbi:unnamed protein product, partial [marine sediment metagenome]